LSVSSTLPDRPERKIWVGSTVKVAAAAAPACGPPHSHATVTAVARNRPGRRPARPAQTGGHGLLVEMANFTQNVSAETNPGFY
jgi:hypothetical protein